MNDAELDQVTARAKERLAKVGAEGKFIFHAESGLHSEDAAHAAGIPLEAVIKCLILEGRGEVTPVAAIIPGNARLDLQALESLTGGRKLHMVTPEKVHQLTGFPVGGVPPVCLESMKRVIVDDSVLEREFVLGSGGSAHVGLLLPPEVFLRFGYSHGRITPQRVPNQ